MATISLAFVFCLLISFDGGLCWSKEELDMFDLVEDIGENFYKLLQVEKDSSTAEIRRSYRRLSLQYHPDKNPDPNAAEIFTKINAVAEVLKDEEKRAMYDEVMEKGLPDWRQPVYYYRRVRKMSFFELGALLLVILTIAQFLYGWAAYFEKQLVLYELKSKRDEKLRKSKGKKTNQQLEAEVLYYEALAKSYVPHIKKLLPFLMLRKSYHLVKGTLFAVYFFVMTRQKRREEEKLRLEKQKLEEEQRKEREREEEEERERQREEEEKARLKSEKKLRKLEQALKATRLKNEQREQEEKKAMASHQESIKEDIETKLREIEEEYEDENDSNSHSKYGRGGKKKKIKKGRRITDLSEATPTINPVDPIDNDKLHDDADVHSSNTTPTNGTDGWSQYQQKQLEWALAHFTKDEESRWDKITKVVPGKSMVECMSRYKELVELVQKKKKDGGPTVQQTSS